MPLESAAFGTLRVAYNALLGR
ncbi:hypothetical protein HYPGJ_20439 [Hyphomicrobium sp. GJ21]|nr:hypothetical protein HYPGJ_20439 [Hyphomicrobium sp. GJ21]